MEIVRRLILVAGLLTGLWLCLWAEPHLFRVDPVDWDKNRQHKERRAEELTQMATETLGRDASGEMDVYAETRLKRDAFIAHETEGRLKVVDGSVWEGFFKGVASTVLGQAPSDSWARHRARWPYDESLYFRTNVPPLAGIATGFSEADPLQYVQIKGQTRSEYLFVQLSDREDLFRHAPAFLVFPHRTAGLIFILGAFLLYFLLPRRPSPTEGLAYAHIRTSTVPDLLGIILGGLFFSLPILISQDNAGESPLAPGWNIITTFMWLLAAISLCSCVAAAWYASLRMDMTPNGLDYTSLRGRVKIAWADIDHVTAFEQPSIPPWLRKTLFVLSLFNRRALGPALMFGGNETGIRVICKNGQAFSFFLTGLAGMESMIGRLSAQSVPIDASVYDRLGIQAGHPALSKPFPAPARRGIGYAIYGIILCAIPAALLAITWPPADPILPAGGLPEKAFAFPREPDIRITMESIRQQEDLLGQMNVVNERMKAIGERLKTADSETRKALVQESGKCMAEVERLSQQFEQSRAAPATAGSTER